MSGSWIAWVREQSSLTSSERMVLREIAGLVDTRGVARIEVSYLMGYSGLCKRQVLRILASLEARGLLQRERCRDAFSRIVGTRIQLLRGQVEEVPVPANPVPRPTALSGIMVTDPGARLDGAQLRDLVIEATVEGWSGPAAQRILEALVIEGPRRFGRIIRARKIFRDAADQWDTLGRAWEVIQTESPSVRDARDPWAVWVTATRRACLRADDAKRQAKDNGVVIIAPDMLAGMSGSQIEEAEDERVYGVDDFGEDLLRLVDALIEAGLPATLAWAGTARITEIVALGRSRKDWLAARDARLRGLGICEQAAREWMTVVAGSRRGRPGLVDMSVAELEQQARLIASLMNVFPTHKAM